MIPVFKRLNLNDKNLDIKKIAESINNMQKELEECLENISSENITELSSDISKITSSLGSVISGDMIKLCGKGGEVFTAGYDKATGLFEFMLTDGDGGIKFIYSDGEFAVN